MNIWQEQVTVRYGNIDKSDRLTLGAAFEYFQEAAISHAASLGVGRDALLKEGHAWVLSRISVFIERRPRYEETVTVRTWPRRSDKLFAVRDYDILDAAGQAQIRGRSGWLFIDVEKRRPIRVENVMERLPHNDGVDSLTSGPVNLAAREDLVHYGYRQAAYSDIDNFGHMNNVSYILWIQDMTSPDLLNQAEQIRLDINYISEIKAGEKIDLFSAPAENCPDTKDYPAKPLAAFAYEGRRTGDGGTHPVFRAELRLGL
ncbi:MAG: thioesterase [Treponema sp.]|nr:thioesterase [Treponema sp.]